MFLESSGFKYDLILLTEVWIVKEGAVLFQLEGYNSCLQPGSNSLDLLQNKA